MLDSASFTFGLMEALPMLEHELCDICTTEATHSKHLPADFSQFKGHLALALPPLITGRTAANPLPPCTSGTLSSRWSSLYSPKPRDKH